MKHKRGFTLIELIIVIAIVALVAAAVFVSVNPEKRLNDAKNSLRLSNANALESAIQKSIVENYTIPLSLSSISTGQEMMLVQKNGTTTGVVGCPTIDKYLSRVDIISDIEDYIGNIPVDENYVDDDTGYYVVRRSNSYFVEPCYSSTETLDTPSAFQTLVESSLFANLKGKWTLDSINGGITADSTNNNYDGTVTGATISSDCPDGNCLLFDTAGENVALGNILNTTSSITISAWVNITAGSDSNWVIVKMGLENWERDWALSERWDCFVMYITGTVNTELYARWSCPAGYERNVWTHVVGVYDATEGSQRLDVYVDGVLHNDGLFGAGQPIVESSLPTSTSPNNLPVYMGARPSDGSNDLLGKIDNVMFFNEAFTDERVAELYNSQKEIFVKK